MKLLVLQMREVGLDEARSDDDEHQTRGVSAGDDDEQLVTSTHIKSDL